MGTSNNLNILIVSINKSVANNFYVPRTYDELYLPDEFYLDVELTKLGYTVYFADQRDWSGEKFEKMYHSSKKIEPLSLSQLSLVLVYDVYLDPENFVKLEFFLKFSIKNNIPVANHPRVILETINKEYLKILIEHGINVVKPYITVKEKVNLIKTSNLSQKFIKKDTIGGGGHGCIIISKSQINDFLEDKYIIQEFMPEYAEGEFSIVFLNSKFQFAFSRHRSKGSDHFTNITQGGTLEKYVPSSLEMEFASSVLNYYYSQNLPILYARIDFIKTDSGPMLTEAELQQPIIPFIFKKWFSKEFAESLDKWRTNWDCVANAT